MKPLYIVNVTKYYNRVLHVLYNLGVTPAAWPSWKSPHDIKIFIVENTTVRFSTWDYLPVFVAGQVPDNLIDCNLVATTADHRGLDFREALKRALVLVLKETTPTQQVCICSGYDLARTGCSCGGFAAEQARKGNS